MERHLWTRHSPGECIRLLREALPDARWRRTPIRGRVLGRSFRVVIYEEKPWNFELSERMAVVIYGTVRENAAGGGSEVILRDYPRTWDPMVWLMELPVILLFLWQTQGPARLMGALFLGSGVLMMIGISGGAESRRRELEVELRWFLRRTMAAEAGRDW